MDDSCFFTYIRRKPLTDDGGYPGYTKHHRFHPSPDGTTIDGHSPVIAKSIPISIPPAAAVVAYTEPGTPALHKAEGFFQRDIQLHIPKHICHPSVKKRQQHYHYLHHHHYHHHHVRNRSQMSNATLRPSIAGPVNMDGDMQRDIQMHLNGQRDPQRVREDKEGEKEEKNGMEKENPRQRGKAAPSAAGCPRCGIWTWNVDRHLKYRCKERRGILLNSRFTSTPQATITTTTTTRSAAVAIPIVVKQLNTGLPLYTRRFGTTAMLLDRRVTSIRARYETLESEKLKRSNSIPSLVKQVAWLSRNFDLKVQEVERLNRLIAEQGIGSSKSFGSSSSSTSAGEE